MHNSEWRFLLFWKRVRGHLVTQERTANATKLERLAGFKRVVSRNRCFYAPERRCTSRSDGFERVSYEVLGRVLRYPEGFAMLATAK
jgi:hypothetical protein